MASVLIKVDNENNEQLHVYLTNLPEYLEEVGEVGKMHLILLIEQLAIQLRVGPAFFPTPKDSYGEIRIQ